VTGSDRVTSDDAIAIIGDLNKYGVVISKKLTILPANPAWKNCSDANADAKITSDDAIKVIGWLNKYGVIVSKKLTVMCPHILP